MTEDETQEQRVQRLREVAELPARDASAEVMRGALAEVLRALDEVAAERDEMRRLGREAEMERDTLAHANELLRDELQQLRTQFDSALTADGRALAAALAEQHESATAGGYAMPVEREHDESEVAELRWVIKQLRAQIAQLTAD